MYTMRIRYICGFWIRCSYGHYEVTELLVKHGASVNVCDLWRFTPLHEGAAKGKYDIVKLLLKHGADATKKNRDGHTPIDLVKEVTELCLKQSPQIVTLFYFLG